MKKLVLIAGSLIAAKHFALIDLNAIPHLAEYAKALLVALIFMPWIAHQFDA